MLELKPNCECCDVDLPPESRDARICSFECTFCRDCTETAFGDTCPNCGGEFVRRPVRPADKLAKWPLSTSRYVNPKHAGRPGFASRGRASRSARPAVLPS